MIKYKLNPSIMRLPPEIFAFDLAMNNRQAIKAMMSIFLAGDICLTNEGYNKLDDSLKSLFIAVEEKE